MIRRPPRSTRTPPLFPYATLFRSLPVLRLSMVAVLALCAAVLSETEFGRRIHAVGGNREAARLAGVPVARDLVGTFILSATLAGLADRKSTRLNSSH